jgi:Tol biopolymer transport system component
VEAPLTGGPLIGQTLSHYRITAALGAGGMGEVYRATDTNLDRDVAIKVLPPEVAEDPERLARFEREAHLLASLNHPNIAAIYGLEEAGGKPFLALELVEGEELKERLERGAIPVDEALEMAQQIAEALEEAHNKGIVHRDLKPANVKLTPDGKVKVLDFGLAKAWGGEAGSGGSSIDLSQSPTLARTGTLAGVILGTAGYMSPEQASGKAVDKRADIWSFGVVLFEMLTGPRLFTGETASEILASVIKEEPSWDALPDGCPPAVTRLLRRCLRKRPRERLQDIGDARLELEEVLAGTGEDAEAEPDGGVASAVELRRLARHRWAWAAVALVSAALTALVAFLHFTEVPEPRLAAHFVLDTPDALSFGNIDSTAVSPDGRHVAFAGVSPRGLRRLWIRSLDSPEARPLSGTEDAVALFWSPDGRSIAFSAGGDLKKLALAGGTVQRICSLPHPSFAGGTWNGEGTIVFAAGAQSASLFSVAAAGGEAKPLTAHDESRAETGHWLPWFLPDGRHFLFDVGSTQEESAGVHVASIDAPAQRRRLLPGGTRVVYASGQLLFVRGGVLFAQPFDPGSLEVSSEPVPVADNVSYWSGWRDWGRFSASPGQVLSYRGGGGTSDAQLVWLDRNGERLGTVGEPGNYHQIALSPDERRVAVEIPDAEGQFDLWVMDVSRGVASRLTSDPANERDPVWSPDGQELAYGSFGVGDHGLFRKDLSGEPASLIPGGSGAKGETRPIPDSWSSDGKTLIYKTLGGTTVWALPLEGGGEAEVVLNLEFILDEPQVSPDGRWLAYVSQESGAWEVYVQPFRRRGERVRISGDGGGQPKWRSDGQELFYAASDGRLMAVDVREGTAGPEVGLPTALFEIGNTDPTADTYGVSADGQRFLVRVPVQGDVEEKIHVVTNWTSLLE